MKKMMLTMMVAAFTLSATAQSKLNFTIKGCENDTVYLIRYYGQKMFYADTAVADASGKLSFKAKFTDKEQGMYAVMPSDKSGYFEVLLNGESVDLVTDKSSYVPKMQIKKSEENKIFYDYIKFITEKQQAAEPLKKKLEEAEGDEKKTIQEELRRLDKEVKEEQKRIILEHKDKLVSVILRLSTDVEVPEAPKDENGNIIDNTFQRNYYVSHFWDGIDLNDERLTRIAGYEKKLEYYFDKVLPQIADSIIPKAEKIVSQLAEGTEIFKYNVVWLTSHYQSSKIMCLDKVFVHMVLNYYKTGKSFWMPEDKNKEIVERAESMEPIVCGAIAHNISLPDTTETNWVRLSDIKAKYRILIFWDPDCGHCKKEMPKVAAKYEEYRALGADVYTVSSNNNDEWRKFVKDNNLRFTTTAVPKKVYEDQQYVNKIVLEGKTDLKSLNYHDTFDIYKTPTIYIIDEHGKIIGKNLESEGISDFLNKLNEQKN